MLRVTIAGMPFSSKCFMCHELVTPRQHRKMPTFGTISTESLTLRSQECGHVRWVDSIPIGCGLFQSCEKSRKGRLYSRHFRKGLPLLRALNLFLVKSQDFWGTHLASGESLWENPRFPPSKFHLTTSTPAVSNVRWMVSGRMALWTLVCVVSSTEYVTVGASVTSHESIMIGSNTVNKTQWTHD